MQAACLPVTPDNLLERLHAAQAPSWFVQAIQHPTTTRTLLTAAGERMHCTFWNEADQHKPSLLLVHGYRAHTHAWDAIAPFFTDRFRVVGVDLMGMGDSQHRQDYGYMREWAADLGHAIEQLALGPTTLVGHSFGGACGIHLSAQKPALLQRLVIVDTVIYFPELDTQRTFDPVGNSRPYPDYATIVGRYRLLPAQPCPPWALAYMAHHSVRPVPGGWSWKFDVALPGGCVDLDTHVALSQVRMPTDYICGDQSNVYDLERLRRIETTIGQGRRAIVIPQAHHHIMMDQPLALITALRTLLA